MTDKEYREQKKRCEKLIKKWVKPIGLGWWSVKYHFIRGVNDLSEPCAYQPVSQNGKWVCIMSTSTDYFYQTANITFYLETVLDNKDDDELERYFVHELMHIFLKPMQTKQKFEEEELVATQLANAMIWARLEGKEDAKV